MAVSKDGEVLIGLAQYENNSTTPAQVVVYRNNNGNFQRHQTIAQTDLPVNEDDIWNDNTNWGGSIDISSDGNMIAISEPQAEVKRTDEDPTKVTNDQGRVFILVKSAKFEQDWTNLIFNFLNFQIFSLFHLAQL